MNEIKSKKWLNGMETKDRLSGLGKNILLFSRKHSIIPYTIWA